MIYIIGTGPLAIEVFSYLDKVGGFIGDRPIKGLERKARVVDTINSFQPDLEDFCVIAEEDPLRRINIAQFLFDRNIKTATAICSGAKVLGQVGLGSIVMPGVCLPHTAEIGEYSVIWPNVYIAPRVKIGNYVNIKPGCVIQADIRDRATIGHLSCIMNNIGEDVQVEPGTILRNPKLFNIRMGSAG